MKLKVLTIEADDIATLDTLVNTAANKFCNDDKLKKLEIAPQMDMVVLEGDQVKYYRTIQAMYV